MPPVIMLLLTAHAFCIVATLRMDLEGSRRHLALTLVTLLPGAGGLLALLMMRVRGGGVALEADAPPAAPRGLCVADVRRLAELPPLLCRLTSTSSSERLAALIAVTNTGTIDELNLLRWAVDHGSPDAVLDAALTLESLELGREARLGDTEAALAAAPTFERAMAVASAAAASILNGTADGAAVPALADKARKCYDVALSLAPLRSNEILEQVARLELAAMRPTIALEVLDRVMTTTVTSGMRQLRNDVAFAARRFELVMAA